MRIPHWPALVCGLVLAATIGRTAVAAPPQAAAPGRVSLSDAIDDPDENDSDSEPIAPGYSPFQPVQFTSGPPAGNPGATAPDQAPGVFYGPGVTPPNAWPQESPYTQHQRQDTYNSGGLWQTNSNDGFGYKNYFSLEYLYAHGLKPGNQTIGSTQNSNVTFFPGLPLTFPSQNTSLFGNVLHNGLRANLGRQYDDGTGVNISAFILFENEVDNGKVGYMASPGQNQTLMAFAGIIVDGPNGGGITLPFDTRLYQQFNQEVLGADVDIYLAPFFERQNFKMKMLWGAKYLRIHEQFYVEGDDSGQGYVAGLPTNGGGNSGNGTNTGFATITGPFTTLLQPYNTTFNASTTNNLVGPQLGLRYDLGGDTFKLWGQTRFSVAADVEQMSVSSNNVNQYKAPGTANTVIAGPDLSNGTNTGSFISKITNTHLSPIIDQSINLEFPGFALIPYVNQWQMFKTAKMRVGYNYVYVGEVARAPEIINYQIHAATINAQRTWFEYSAVNFAIDWRF